MNMMAVYIGDIKGTWAYTPEKGPEHGKIGEPLPGQPSHLERRELEGALKAQQSRLISVQEAPGPGCRASRASVEGPAGMGWPVGTHTLHIPVLLCQHLGKPKSVWLWEGGEQITPKLE